MKGLRIIRQKLKLSFLDLEEMTGIDANTLSRYERGVVTPSVTKAEEIAKALHVSVEDLLNGTSNEKIKVIISHDWEEYEKGEINMDGNLFELFLGTKGQLGLKGAGLPTTREELQELKERICNDLDSMFELQVKRGAIQTA